MRAATIIQCGQPPVVVERPEPAPGEGTVTVTVTAAPK